MQEERGYRPFTELDAWKIARRLKLPVYEIARRFPSEEKFELTRRLIRSARSVPANISERHGRFTYKEQYSFCVIARGSLMETLNHLIDAFDCGYISKTDLTALKDEIDEAGKVLNGYMAFLKSRATR